MTSKTPLRIRTAIVSNRLLARLTRGIEAVHGGVWLGLLDGDQLAGATSSMYSDHSYYAELDYNTSGLLEWEREAVELHFPPGGRVLVASAGGGRELFGLEAMGFHPTGFDPSEHLVSVGRGLIEERGSSAELLLSEPDSVPEGLDPPYDAIVFGWAGYIHVRGRSTRVAFLERLRELVPKGAPLLISFFLRSGEGRQFTVARNVGAAIRRVRRVGEPVEMGDTVAGMFEHYFTWAEVEKELADAGFSVVSSSGAAFPHIVGRAV